MSRLIGLLLIVAGLYVAGAPASAASGGPRLTTVQHWVRGDASANRAAFFACLGEGDRCTSDEQGAMSPAGGVPSCTRWSWPS